jgi:hypothetical protein
MGESVVDPPRALEAQNQEGSGATRTGDRLDRSVAGGGQIQFETSLVQQGRDIHDLDARSFGDRIDRGPESDLVGWPPGPWRGSQPSRNGLGTVDFPMSISLQLPCCLKVGGHPVN